MSDPTFTITGSSITTIINGETFSIKAGAPNFMKVRAAILSADWAIIPGLCQHGIAIADFVVEFNAANPQRAPQFIFKDNVLFYDDERLPNGLNKAILGWCERGNPAPFLKFWANANENPSNRSLTQMWDFMAKHDLAIDEEGYIIAKKGVDTGYLSLHSGPKGKLNYTPGNFVAEPRNKISDDPRSACSRGIHVGGSQYVNTFGGQRILVRVHPKDVVSVPYDHSSAKMRVCAVTSLCDWDTKELPAVIELKDLPIKDKVRARLALPVPTPVEDVAEEDDVIVQTMEDLEEKVFNVATANRDALRAKAKDLQVPGRSNMNAGELRRILTEILAAKVKSVGFDVETANRNTLRQKAKELEIAGRGGMNASALRDAVRAALNAPPKAPAVPAPASASVPAPVVPAPVPGNAVNRVVTADALNGKALSDFLSAQNRDFVRTYAKHVGVTGASKVKGGAKAVIALIVAKRG